MSGSESGKSPEKPLGFAVGESNSDAAAQGVRVIPSPAGTASLAPPVSSTPLTAEEMDAVLSEQPTGAAPSPEEIEDRRDAQNSAQNVLPREKLENGLKQARAIFATGWAGFTASVREIEQSETMGKIKEGTVSIIDRSMDGLSKVGSKVAEVTDKSIGVVGAKLEEAKPTLGRWRDEVVIASERGFTAAKEMTEKAIDQVKRPSTGRGNGEGGAGVDGGAGYDNGTGGGDGGGEASGEKGPHTV